MNGPDMHRNPGKLRLMVILHLLKSPGNNLTALLTPEGPSLLIWYLAELNIHVGEVPIRKGGNDP